MDRAIQLVEDLVSRIPEFGDLYSAHVFDQDGVLPHLFFWDVTQETVASYLGDPELPDWRGTLQFLEEQIEVNVPEVDVVIGTSFLDCLPYPEEPGHGIIEHLGPLMAEKFARIRPKG
jgi:hypothetical protein